MELGAKALILPREKAERQGIASLSDAELLALLLDTGTRSENVLELSHRLLVRNEGLYSFFLRDSERELGPGIGIAKGFRLRAVTEILRRIALYSIIPIKNEKEFYLGYRYCFFGQAEEALLLLLLDKEKKVIGVYCFRGRERDKITVPWERISTIVQEKKPRYAYLAHNHPSGDCSPSAMDRQATRECAHLLRQQEVILLGSLVFTSDGYGKAD